MNTISPSNLVYVETHRGYRRYEPMIFGQFLEHFHRQVYGGIFEPGSPLSDAQGFRLDVLAALQQLKIPIVRWPGGCFVSAYHWRDGVGPERQANGHRHPHQVQYWSIGNENYDSWEMGPKRSRSRGLLWRSQPS